MMKISDIAKQADTQQARDVLAAGLAEVFALAGNRLSLRVDPSQMIVKGPIEKYLFRSDDFVSNAPVASPYTGPDFLFVLCRPEPGGRLTPVGFCELRQEDGGRFEFSLAGQSVIEPSGADRLGIMLDRVLDREKSETAEDEKTVALGVVLDAYMTFLAVRPLDQQGPPSGDDLSVYLLNPERPSHTKGFVERTSIADLRGRVRNMIERLDATGEGDEA